MIAWKSEERLAMLTAHQLLSAYCYGYYRVVKSSLLLPPLARPLLSRTFSRIVIRSDRVVGLCLKVASVLRITDWTPQTNLVPNPAHATKQPFTGDDHLRKVTSHDLLSAYYYGYCRIRKPPTLPTLAICAFPRTFARMVVKSRKIEQYLKLASALAITTTAQPMILVPFIECVTVLVQAVEDQVAHEERLRRLTSRDRLSAYCYRYYCVRNPLSVLPLQVRGFVSRHVACVMIKCKEIGLRLQAVSVLAITDGVNQTTLPPILDQAFEDQTTDEDRLRKLTSRELLSAFCYGYYPVTRAPAKVPSSKPCSLLALSRLVIEHKEEVASILTIIDTTPTRTYASGKGTDCLQDHAGLLVVAKHHSQLRVSLSLGLRSPRCLLAGLRLTA